MNNKAFLWFNSFNNRQLSYIGGNDIGRVGKENLNGFVSEITNSHSYAFWKTAHVSGISVDYAILKILNVSPIGVVG